MINNKFKFEIKKFEELTALELYRILQLRAEVFLLEQNCIYEDMDNKDLVSYQVLGYQNDELVATARLVPEGISYPNYCSLGRVCNSSKVRNQGVGRELMKVCIQKCLEVFPNLPIKISGQSYLIKFYTDLGFQLTDKPEYMEDQIPHREMIYSKSY